jgi:outer membrane receptor for ferric coprogen and ferric-rhodotorulic acid
LADYDRFAGQMAKLKTDRAIGNNQRNFRGRIIATEGDTVVFDDRTNGEVRIPFTAIAKANLEIDTEAEFRLAAQRGREAEQRAKGNGENESAAEDI